MEYLKRRHFGINFTIQSQLNIFFPCTLRKIICYTEWRIVILRTQCKTCLTKKSYCMHCWKLVQQYSLFESSNFIRIQQKKFIGILLHILLKNIYVQYKVKMWISLKLGLPTISLCTCLPTVPDPIPPQGTPYMRLLWRGRNWSITGNRPAFNYNR